MHDADNLCTLINEVREELKADIGALKLMVRESMVRCEPCYRTVMGNGQPGIEKRLAKIEQSVASREGVVDRVTKLEERDQTRVRIVATAIAAAGVVAGVVSGTVALIRWMLGA